MAKNHYGEVTHRILAQLEAGAPPWIKEWKSNRAWKHPQECRDEAALLRRQRHFLMGARVRNPALAHIQTGRATCNNHFGVYPV